MTHTLEMRCTVDEIWARRFVMADSMNAQRLEVYEGAKALRRMGDKLNAVVSRAAPCITKQAAAAAEAAAKENIPSIPHKREKVA